jgi:hypothetical protein
VSSEIFCFAGESMELRNDGPKETKMEVGYRTVSMGLLEIYVLPRIPCNLNVTFT